MLSSIVLPRRARLALLFSILMATMVVAEPPDSTALDFAHARAFGKTPRGEPVTLYTLTNKNGMSVSLMDYGATVQKIIVPDRTGKLDDVALGFDRLAPYFHQTAYFGAIAGRYANRIAKGQFELGRTIYQLPINNGPNSLHGGVRGFDKRLWKAEPVEGDASSIRFSRFSPEGEEGYPGNLFVSVTYTLTENNELRIVYHATTDKTTILNLTNHTYFNLAGAGHGTILNQVLTLHANAFTPVDDTLIPTGEIKDVAGTPWDFRTATPIGLHLKETGGKPVGYDHNFVLNKGFFSNMAVAAEVYDPESGRTLTVSTDQPGVQFYTGNFLDGTLTGIGGTYRQYGGFCLETQHFPDSPNHDNFPSTVLGPGQSFNSATIYAFGVK